VKEMNDKPKTTLVDGSPVNPDHLEINPKTGQQKAYVVLSAEERAKGFVRPVRRSYTHLGKVEMLEGADGSIFSGQRRGGCGQTTRMSLPIAETYARDNKFYTHTFCIKCGTHLPVNEFVWEGTDEEVGS
jgi:hypothetical protein